MSSQKTGLLYDTSCDMLHITETDSLATQKQVWHLDSIDAPRHRLTCLMRSDDSSIGTAFSSNSFFTPSKSSKRSFEVSNPRDGMAITFFSMRQQLHSVGKPKPVSGNRIAVQAFYDVLPLKKRWPIVSRSMENSSIARQLTRIDPVTTGLSKLFGKK